MTAHPLTHDDVGHEAGHRTLREALIVGALGATAVALWFLLVDTAAGRPLYTPSFLGQAVAAAVGGAAPQAEVSLPHAALYTLIHYAAFTAVGFVGVQIVHASRRQPALLALVLLAFAAFEVAFVGLVALLQLTRVGGIAWTHVAVGNLLAAVSMGVYLWRTHPMLVGDFARGVGGPD
ncbi:MAG TPA: hypothetical protein VNA89_14730 [Gemmatimonadaceae bacterium]|nr:hypothetical protein [Gemmatimonadaceae bacterium]